MFEHSIGKRRGIPPMWTAYVRKTDICERYNKYAADVLNVLDMCFNRKPLEFVSLERLVADQTEVVVWTARRLGIENQPLLVQRESRRVDHGEFLGRFDPRHTTYLKSVRRCYDRSLLEHIRCRIDFNVLQAFEYRIPYGLDGEEWKRYKW